MKKYGWRPDLPDQRDMMYAVSPATMTALPPRKDLRKEAPELPPLFDQGELGSCTANASATAVQYARAKAGLNAFTPSRLFIYYNTRAIEGTLDEDSGAMLRDVMRTLQQQGVCTSETDWPYVIDKFATKPPEAAYEIAAQHQVVRYRRIVQSLNQLKGCLASGFPFVFGFTAYETFESDEVAKTGKVPLPHPNEKVLGGHAVLAVGYDDAEGVFIVRNSWGSSWGQGGYFTMPYAYLLDASLATDFWTVRMVEA